MLSYLSSHKVCCLTDIVTCFHLETYRTKERIVGTRISVPISIHNFVDDRLSLNSQSLTEKLVVNRNLNQH